MKLDEYGVLVSEIWPDTTRDGWCANRGDSMSNTSRLVHLRKIIDPSIHIDYTALESFVTRSGYLRHPAPMMPDDWKEADSPTDQCLPFYLAANIPLRALMRERIKNNGWRTGNGDIVSPIFYAILTNSQFKINLSLLGQLIIFKIPVRWNDERRCFESSGTSSCDWINFFHCLTLAPRWLLKLVNKNTIKEKIESYYKNEPNADWLLELYSKAIEKVLA